MFSSIPVTTELKFWSRPGCTVSSYVYGEAIKAETKLPRSTRVNDLLAKASNHRHEVLGKPDGTSNPKTYRYAVSSSC